MRNFIQNLKSLKSLTEIFKALLNYATPVKVACSQPESSHSSRVLSRITPILPAISLVIALMAGSVNTWSQTYNSTEKKWYSLYDGTERTNDKVSNIKVPCTVYPPTTGTISIDWKKDRVWAVVTWSYPGFDLYVGGTSNSNKIAYSNAMKNEHTSYETASTSIGTDITSVDVYYHCSSTGKGHIKDIRIPLAQHIWLQDASGTNKKGEMTKSFGNVRWGESKGIMINFRSFLTAGKLNVTIVGDTKGDFSFSSTTQGVHTLTTSENGKSFPSSGNMCASANGTAGTACATGVLGKASEYDFKVYFYPKKANVGTSYTGNSVYVLISDGTNSAKVYLRGKCVKRGQIISWDNSDLAIKTTDNITFDAVGKDSTDNTIATNISVTYAPTSGSPAYMDGNALKVVTSGNVTITASAAGDDYYNAAPNVTRKITIDKVTPKVTWPTIASGLIYNETCAVGDKVSDHWTGGSAVDDKDSDVKGAFSCDALLLPEKNSTGYTATFAPTNTNWYNSTTGTIKKDVAKADQEISWALEENQEYASGLLMNATSTGMGYEDTLVMRYFTDHPEWGYIDEDNYLQVRVANKTLQITAWQGGNANWNRVDSVKTIITAGTKPNDTTEITASTITYGKLLSASQLNGDVKHNGVKVEGKLEWVDSTYLPKAGTGINAKKYPVNFIPTDGGYSTITFLVTVEVNKADPTIKWNISENLREKSVYNGIVESNNKEKVLLISESSDYLTVDGLNLHTLEIGDVKTGEITISASQAESDNYNAISVEKKIIINPRFEVCLPVDISVADDTTIINDMGGAYTGTHSWCVNTNNGTGEIAGISTRYTQYYGLQLGEWTEGLNKFWEEFYEDLSWWDMLGNVIKKAIEALSDMQLPGSDKMIELNFTGVPQSLSFDVKLQQVYYYDIFKRNYQEANQNNPTWKVYQISGNGVESLINTYDAKTTSSINVPLDSTARSVKIILNSPFAGFIQNLEITQKKYIRAHQSSLSFGTYTPIRPLQEPQTLNVYYSSVGTCDYPNDTIVVTTDKPEFFYVDKDTIYSSVGIDQVGKDSVRVRCNDVKVTGAHVIFTSLHSGATLSVPVSSANPAISSGNAKTGIFQTGTEHTTDGVYLSARNHDFSACFNGGSALFDTLYIYGVSASAINNRQWEIEGGNKVPKVTTSNVHTPCFVYKNDGTQYVHVRTVDAATKTLNISTDKKIAFLGYKPADLTKSISAVHVTGNASIYLNNAEMLAKNAVLELDGTIALYAQGTNVLESNNASSIKLAGSALTINGNAADGLALRRASYKPSIDLGGNGSVEINGATLELHNGTRMAIENVGGQYTDGSVRINDGTIIGEATLYLPWNTQINGGTFNTGTVKVYNKKGNIKRPKNRFGELLDRQTMKKDALPDWYGKSNLVEDEFMVHPMLLDESVYVFNGESKTDSLSSTQPDNWNQNNVPEPNSDAYITAPVVITDTLTLNSLTIKEGENITVTIAPTGGLTIGEDGIFGATKDNLILKADSAAKSETKGMTGFLRIDPEFEEGMPEATVELFSKAYYDYNKKLDDIAQWQYVGSPLASKDVPASSVFKMSWIYSWDEEDEQWKNERASLKLTPFVGYATTQRFYSNGALLTYKGQLVSNRTDVNINLAWSGEKKGRNVLANSFTAPIDITKFEDGDFVNCDSVIYLFNTGSRRDAKNANADANAKKSYDVAGQYLHIPIGSARLLKGYFGLPTIIAPMQGFYIHATNADAHITLNYSKLVWTGDYKNNPNTPLHSPKRTKRDEEEVGALQISLYANGGADNLYILESEQFDANFENGMDARKLMGEGLNIFTIEDNEQLGVDATNSLIGTRVGVRTNEETAYTMSFSHLQSEDELALLDTETNETTDIDEGTEYTFYAEPNSEILGRFQIVGRAKAPSTPTGVNEVESDNKVHKFIKDNQLYILKNGVLYNGMGAVVR